MVGRSFGQAGLTARDGNSVKDDTLKKLLSGNGGQASIYGEKSEKQTSKIKSVYLARARWCCRL